MTEDKITRLATGIYEHVGGSENVERLVHCMTRVRLSIRDKQQVDLAQLKALEGVLGVVEDDTLQVVVGPGTVNKVAQKMVDQVGVKLGDPFPEQATLADLTASKKAQIATKYNKPNRFKAVSRSLANIFIPMIPAFVGAGILAGFAAVLSNLLVAKVIDGNEWQQLVAVLGIINKGMFAYLSIYVGINAASEFGATPALGGVIGGTILLTGMNPEMPLKNFLTGEPLSANQGGIIGVILAVWLLSMVEKRLHRVVPEAIDIIVTPAISILVIGLMTIFVIMPLAGLVSDHLVGGINAILHIGGPISGFVLGALFLPMVMFGLHQILTPIHLQMIEKTGSTQLLPILAMAGGGQVGAALALWVRLRHDKAFVNIVKGALPVGILGIGEPLIYAVTLPLGRPFVTACLGGGLGGAFIGLMGNAGASAIGPSGLALVPLIVEGKWWVYLGGLLCAYLGGFVLTYAFGVPKSALEKSQQLVTQDER